MSGHIEVERFPAAMLPHQEHEQDLQPDRRNRKEINQYDPTQVIPEKSLPGLRRWSWNSPLNP